jgi:hypothetical protein
MIFNPQSPNYNFNFSHVQIESSHCFQKCDRNWGHRLLYGHLLENFSGLNYVLIYPTHWKLMKSVGSHGISSLLFITSSRWWSDTLWVTLIRLWLHWLSWYCQIVVVEISLQFYRYPVQTSLDERVNQQSFDTPLNCNQFLHFLCKHCLAQSHTIFKFQVFARTRHRSEHSPADPWRHICPKRHHCAIAQLH